MKSIGQLVSDARTASKLKPAKFAKSLKIGPSMLNQLERDRPVVISDETLIKLQKAGIKTTAKQVEEHNYIARACAKAKNWSKEFREKLAKGALPITPELATVKAAKPAKKVAAPKKAKPAESATRQGFLPNFLGQLNNARVEELVAEKIFQAVATRVEEAADAAFGTRKKA